MSIQSITSSIYTNYSKSTTNQAISVSKDAFKQALASGDILMLGSDDESVYATYTNSGICANSVSAAESTNAVSESTESDR